MSPRATYPVCTRTILAAGGAGRVVFMTRRGPVAVLVNYRVLEGDVVFRIAEDTNVTAVSGANR